ncbi:MAG: acyl-CoA dehydrogenase family protein [Alphaproteobacteria bacterium]
MADRTFLDWPFFDAGHRGPADEIELWADDVLEPLIEREHAAGADNDALDAVSRDMVAELGAAGWLEFCIPAGDGGRHASIDVRSLCMLREALARRSGLADFAFAMQGLGSAPISLFGSAAQRSRYLPDIAAGRRIAAFAISESNAGSDPGAMETTALADGDGYVLNGAKTWISNAGLAHQYVVFARTGEGPGAKGISAFVVDADAPGLSVSERISVIAPHPLGAITFDDCRVPGDALLGEAGRGFGIAMATLGTFRATVGAAALGMARRALDEALARTEERMIGSERLADYQLTKAKIADMAVKIDAAALLIYRAAWTKDTGQGRGDREVSMAKLYATEAAQQVVDDAVQLFGGLGVTTGMTVELLYREVRALRIYEGTTEIQKLIIADKTRAAFHGG